MNWVNYAATALAILAAGVAGACIYALYLEHWR